MMKAKLTMIFQIQVPKKIGIKYTTAIKFKQEKLVSFSRSFILLHVSENKYGKYNLIDRYDPISPATLRII